MRRIYILLIALLISPAIIFADSYNTIAIDGNNSGWTASETFTNCSAADNAYITWDANYIYIGIADAEADYGNMATFVYFDVDPTGTDGTTDAYAWGNNITTPFNADYVVAWKNKSDDDYIEVRDYNDGTTAWDLYGSTSTTSLNTDEVNFAIGDDYREVRIKRSIIGNPNAIKIAMFSEQNYSPFYRYFTWPSDGWTDANRTAGQSIPNYYGFILMDNISPITANYYKADIKSWDNGGADSKWGTAANWTTDTEPGSATLAILPSGSTVEVDAAEECFDLLIETGSTVDIKTTTWSPKGLTVGGNITNNAGSSGLTLEAGGNQRGGYLIHNTENVDASVELYFSGGLWHYMSSPVDNFSSNFDDLGLGLTGGVNEDQFYYWHEPTAYWIDILNSSIYTNTGFEVCEGYIFNYQNSNPTKSFSGKLIHDDQTITLTKASKGTFDGWNLVSNPFAAPLAINANAATNNLLAANTGIIDPLSGLYFWDESTTWPEEGINDYVARNNATQTWENPYVPTGQSFMVKALNDNVDFSFPANCRIGVASQYLKNAKDDFQRLYIGVENPELGANVLKIVFAENCTDGADPFFDALKFKGNPNLAFYSTLVAGDNRDFEIQCLAPLTEEKEVYLGLDAEITGEYTMFVDTLVNFPEDYTFEIEDTQTGAIINLKQSKYFTFDVNETGAFKDRFTLRFKSTVGIGENRIAQIDQFEIYVANQMIYLNTIDPIKKANISVFNTLGQQVVSQQMYGQSTQISIAEPGAYIVRVQTEQGVQSQKVIIF